MLSGNCSVNVQIITFNAPIKNGLKEQQTATAAGAAVGVDLRQSAHLCTQQELNPTKSQLSCSSHDLINQALGHGNQRLEN